MFENEVLKFSYVISDIKIEAPLTFQPCCWQPQPSTGSSATQLKN